MLYWKIRKHERRNVVLRRKLNIIKFPRRKIKPMLSTNTGNKQ